MSASSGSLRWCTVRLAADALAAYRETLGFDSPQAALDGLTRAVAGSLHGADGVHAVAAPRQLPPRLAFLVVAGDAVEAGISAQVESLERCCRYLRFVDHRQADAVAAVLAAQLERRLGEELERYELAAIPRGGWLVAGLVAGHLGRPLASAGGAAAAGTLVVDDCALSGVALRRFARQAGDRPIVFAPLFAPRQLAREIELQIPRVRAVIVGEELADLGLELPSGEYEAWRRSWRPRLREQPCWLGLPEFVCFPWNEPKRWVWNPVAESLEPGWRLLPGELCLEARAVAPPPAASPPGEFEPAGQVVAAEVDGAVHVGDLAGGGSWRLEGPAAVFWQGLTRRGGRGRAVADVVDRFAVDHRTAARDLDRWLEELTGRGLLVER